MEDRDDEESEPIKRPKDPIGRLISENTHYSKNKDDLLDIHVGNPLRKITDILEEIKNQKAFSFTLKGSLGITGVFLALSLFGIFGGQKLMCDKGTHSQIGIVKILNITETEPITSIPVLSNIIRFLSPKITHPRAILVKKDNSTLSLPYSRNVNFVNYKDITIVATGHYDSCSQTLLVDDPNGVEAINPI